LDVDAYRVAEDEGTGGLLSGFFTDVIHDGGFLFGTDGSQIDAATFTQLRRYELGGVIRPDVANGRAFYAYRDQGGNLRMTAVSPFDGSELGELFVDDTPGFSFMERFGVDGMAFGGDDRVFFVRSDLIGP